MAGQGVLLIATKQRLVVIDLTKKSAVKIFNFVEEGFPFAASFFKRGSKLYMVGGEETLPGLPEERLLNSSSTNLDETTGTGGLSRKIYVSNLTTMDSITEFEEHSVKTLAPKASPIVEEIQGMIYVLAGHPCHYKDSMPTPPFEAYDLSRYRLEALPTPPFYSTVNHNYPDYIISGHYVLGDTIYVRAGMEYFSFSTNDRKWTSLSSPHEVPVLEPLRPCNNCKFVPGYEDVVIYYSGDAELLMAVKLLPLPPDGEIVYGPDRLRIQCLNEVYSVQENVFWRGDGVIVAMGDEHEHQMCFVRPEILEIEKDYNFLYRILVIIFRVEKLKNSDDAQEWNREDKSSPFLSVTCLSHEFYNLNEWGIEVPQIRSALFHPWS